MSNPGFHRLTEITSKDLSDVRRLAANLMDVPDLEMLGQELIMEAERILPADFMLWNIWTSATDAMLGCHANNDHYRQELELRSDALSATIHHHPAIAAGQLAAAHLRPQRMSDYQSDAAFRSNPLFNEVYRHVDSRYQIACVAARLEDQQVILSWNMGGRDFTDREVQLMHLIGKQVGMLSRRIAERAALDSAWTALNHGLAKIGGPANGLAAGLPALSKSDGFIIAALIRGESRAAIATRLRWRRDSLDRHLGYLRERIGYENVPQMVRDFSDLSPARTTMNRNPEE